MKKGKRISKRAALIFLLSVVLSMWAGLDICAQRIKYTYDNAGNRLSRQKEIVVQTRGALNDEEDLSIYDKGLDDLTLEESDYISEEEFNKVWSLSFIKNEQLYGKIRE